MALRQARHLYVDASVFLQRMEIVFHWKWKPWNWKSFFFFLISFLNLFFMYIFKSIFFIFCFYNFFLSISFTYYFDYFVVKLVKCVLEFVLMLLNIKCSKLFFSNLIDLLIFLYGNLVHWPSNDNWLNFVNLSRY